MLLDRGIELRLSQLTPVSVEHKHEMAKVRLLHKKLFPFYYIVFVLYLALPIWDTPTWCMITIR